MACCRRKESRSVLDAISNDAKGLEKVLGKKDKSTLDEYLDNIAEIERRLNRASYEEDHPDLSLPGAPVGIPYSFDEHIKLMYDLLALAYQTNVTRVFSFMVARDQFSGIAPQYWYFWIGVLLITVVMVLPNGIVGGLSQMYARWRRK